MSSTPQVSITDFITFVQSVMGISANYLPITSPQLTYALNYALNETNCSLAQLCARPGSWTLYQTAVLNLAGALLIEHAQDQSWPITAASWTYGSITVTTPANTIIVGDQVLISGVSPIQYSAVPEGQRAVTVYSVLSTTQFQYLLAPNPGPAIIGPNAAVTEQFFATARRNFKLTDFSPGIVTSANDLSTGVGLLNQGFFSGLTLENLQLAKTPWGRTYMSIAQNYGPTIWGLT